MTARETHRTNTEARADVAACGPRPTGDTELLRYLAATAYREDHRERDGRRERGGNS